jgi:MerC mercury resistance protein
MNAVSRKVAVSGWDNLGMIAGTACAVHCAALPFLIAIVPMVGLQHPGDERLEHGVLSAWNCCGKAESYFGVFNEADAKRG